LDDSACSAALAVVAAAACCCCKNSFLFSDSVGPLFGRFGGDGPVAIRHDTFGNEKNIGAMCDATGRNDGLEAVIVGGFGLNIPKAFSNIT